MLALAAMPLAKRGCAAGRIETGLPVIASARIGDRDHAVLLDADGKVSPLAELPGRGHGGAFQPGGRHMVMFARRPGLFAFIFDRGSGAIRHVLEGPPGRHFYGHGTYSPDGRLLYSTENDYDAERGVVGVWDAADGYRRVGEFDSFGIGPHDAALMPDGHTLVIANGGILTHPDTGRHKLNIPDMAPSLATVDVRSGERTGQWSLPREFHKLSIRHLARTRDAGVIAAMQYEGPASDTPPLVLRLGRDGFGLMPAPRDVQRRMNNYAGSATADTSGALVAVSAPRGNLVTFWSHDGAYLSSFEMPDGCGLASSARSREFLLSGGDGRLVRHRPDTGRILSERSVAGYHWDNHMLADRAMARAGGA